MLQLVNVNPFTPEILATDVSQNQKQFFPSSFSDNDSIVLLIHNPLTAWLLPLCWHLMLKFGAVIIQHFILALLSKKNSSWFVASMQDKKKSKHQKWKTVCLCFFFSTTYQQWVCSISVQISFFMIKVAKTLPECSFSCCSSNLSAACF